MLRSCCFQIDIISFRWVGRIPAFESAESMGIRLVGVAASSKFISEVKDLLRRIFPSMEPNPPHHYAAEDFSKSLVDAGIDIIGLAVEVLR